MRKTPLDPRSLNPGEPITIRLWLRGGGYALGVLQGILKYAAQRDWNVALAPDDTRHRPQTFFAQGAIAQVDTTAYLAAYRDWGIPVVNIADSHADRSLPTVGSDNVAIGRLAAEDFLTRGLRRFAFVGYDHNQYAVERHAGFCSRIREAGGAVHTLWQPETPVDLAARIARLPRPTAILAENDMVAITVLRACELAGISVPDEVAVLGVDNDLTVCETWRTPLSSVAINTHQIGTRAAEILDGMLQGNAPPSKPVLVAPVGVVHRQSSSFCATEDRVLAQTLELIRKRVDDPPSVEELAKHAGLSRRQLTRRFQAALGRSPSDELRRVRMERAKALLECTRKSIVDIAVATGFESPSHFSALFRRTTGLTPVAYREARALESDP